MKNDRKLRIAIDCRISNPRQGVGSAVLSFAKALSETTRFDQEYTFLVPDDLTDWLAPYVYGPCRLQGVVVPSIPRWKRVLRAIPPIRYLWGKLRGSLTSVPVSDGYIESQNFDLVHFPTQTAFLTALPSIYQPWDLQHLHYPQFFTKSEILQREKYYRAFCQHAAYVCVQAQWTKQDLVRHYGISEDKIAVIPWGSVFGAYKAPSDETRRAVRNKYELPPQYFVYPAVTWPHKNHEVIIRALHILKEVHNRSAIVYFTGASTEFRSTLEQIAEKLAVSGQIHYLGFLPSEELQAIFKAGTAMIFPSKFEGFGLPILEAFDAHLPVLSSNATTLPEVGKDAALYFDPDAPQELAELMMKMMDDSELRRDMVKKGIRILAEYSIKDTAASFQVLYDKLAERPSLESPTVLVRDE
jgi:glycosyltransferase involved in cell wall biosynthesis